MSKKFLYRQTGRVVVCVVLYVPTVAAAGEKVELRAKFRPGATCYVESREEVVRVMDGPMGGGKMEMTFHQMTGILNKVESSSEDGTKILLTFDRAGMSFSHPAMGDIHYDSDMPHEDESPMVKQIAEPQIGMSVAMELDKNNEVIQVSGMKAILDKVAKGAVANPFLGEVKKMLTDDAAKSTLGRTRLAVLPNKVVEVGETWTIEYDDKNPHLGVLRTSFSCKLDRVATENGRKVAIISYKGKLRQDPKTKPPGMMPGTVTTLDEGTFEGKATFDIKQSEIVREVRETRLKTTDAPKDGGEGAPARKSTMTVKETITVKSTAERAKEKKANLKKAEAERAEREKAEKDDEWDEDDEDEEDADDE